MKNCTEVGPVVVHQTRWISVRDGAKSRRLLAVGLAVACASTVVACGSVPVGPESNAGERAAGRGDASVVEPPATTEVKAEPAPQVAASGRRIVAIGDVHGDLDATRRALRLSGLIDTADHWIGGETVLVQTGDQLDRGDDEREILELFEQLIVEAKAAGGEVHVLNGNHELMNASGDFRYVTEGGWEDFADVDTTKLAQVTGNAQIPEHAKGRVAAFMPGGPWAQKLATRDVVFVYEGNVFVHGGVTPAWASIGAKAINESVQAWLREGGAPPKAVTDDEGPVWTRAYSASPDAGDCAALSQSLAALGASRMIVGHTVQKSGVASACDGHVWMIDVGMAAHYGGSPAALEIIGDQVRVLAE